MKPGGNGSFPVFFRWKKTGENGKIKRKSQLFVGLCKGDCIYAGLEAYVGVVMAFSMVPGALGAAAFSCPHSFSVLEVTGIGAAAAILTLLAWERLQKGKGLTDRLFWGGKALGCGWLLIPAGISVCITLNGLLILTGLESASGMYDGMAELIYGSGFRRSTRRDWGLCWRRPMKNAAVFWRRFWSMPCPIWPLWQ